MRTRKKHRGERGRALIERMEDRLLLSAALPNGTANAIAYDAGGKLWVAYYDASAHNLKYALRNADGTWAVQAGLIDAGSAPTGYTPDVGQMVTMTIERGGLPGVAYYDATNADLKYAHFNGTSWDVSLVESYRTTGYYPSIAYNPGTGRPAIAYYYATNGDLRLRQFNGTNWGTDTDYQWVDGVTDNVGRFDVLALDRAGRWTIGYDDSTNGAGKFAIQGTGGVWTTRMVDNAPVSDVAFTSIAFDNSNRAALAYYDTNGADLKFAKGTDSSGATWTVETLAAKNTAGKYTNVSYDTVANKFTVYYNYEAGGNTKINYLTGNTGSWGDAQTLYSGGGSENHIVSTPGVAGGLTYSWSGVDGVTGQQNLYVNDSTTGTAWRQETADAGVGRLFNAGAVVHTVNGVQKIYVVDGYGDHNAPGTSGTMGGGSSLVRVSGDGGATWSYWAPQGANGGPAPAARSAQTVVSFQGKLWMVGGVIDYTGYVKEVWSSPDGVAWTREADLPAGFAARGEMASAVSGDGSTLYLIGGTGIAGTDVGAEVWSTTDGQTWTLQNAAAPFGSRHSAAALYFNNRLWVLGGQAGAGGTTDDYKQDAWWSADGGVTWTNATAAAGATLYGNREGLSAVVHDNRMWVMGGDVYTGGDVVNQNTAWYSFDGINWTQAAQNTALSRVRGNAVEFGGRIVYMFGTTPAFGDDVWSAA